MGQTVASQADVRDIESVDFVGRTVEQHWLTAGQHAVAAGKPQVMLVSGSPGIGKSRLLREFLRTMRNTEFAIGIGRGYQDFSFPYQPWMDVLRALDPQTPLPLEAHGVKAEEIFDDTSTTQSRIAGRHNDDLRGLFLGVFQTLIDRAGRSPLLIVLDDLHWMDRSSIDLFLHVVQGLADAAMTRPIPIMLVTAYRTLEERPHLSRALARARRAPVTHKLALGGLDHSDVHLFLEQLGLPRPAPQLVDTILEATDGNPLFIQEVVYQLRARNALEQRQGFTITPLKAMQLALPTDVHSAIASRLQDLDHGTLDLITWAALLGTRFSLDELCLLSGADEDAALDGLDAAAGFVTSARDAFRFAHPLYRHVLLQRLNTARRERMHALAAQKLEALPNDRKDSNTWRVAQHLMDAGPRADPNKLLRFCRTAADQAAQVFGWPNAARAYSAAAAVATSEQERGELHYKAGTCHRLGGDVGPCLEQFDLALDAFRVSGDNRATAEVMMWKARQETQAVPFGELVVRPFEEALELLGDGEDSLRGSIFASISNAYFHAGMPLEAKEKGQEALAIGRRIEDPDLCNDALSELGLAQTQDMELEAAVKTYREAIELADLAGNRSLINVPAQRLTNVLYMLGRLEDARRNAEEGLEVARQTNYPSEESMACASLTMIAAATGHFDDVLHHSRQAMKAFHRSHYAFGPYIAMRALAYVRCMRGAAQEAEDAIAPIVEPGRVFANPGALMAAQQAVSSHYIHAVAGQSSPAGGAENRARLKALEEHLRRLEAGRLRAQSMSDICAIVEMAEVYGGPDLARTGCALLATALSKGILLTHGWCFLVPRVLGAGYALLGDYDSAADHFEQAIGAATAMDARPELARSCFDYARMLTANGYSHEARDLLVQAHETFRDLGMVDFARKAANLGQVLDLHLDPPERQTDRPVLAALEIDLLKRIAAGESEQQIAESLFLSSDHLETTAKQLYAKLDITGRNEAAAFALSQGLIDYQPSQDRVPVTILVTDMVDSTGMVERLGDERAQVVMHLHDQVLRTCIRDASGTEITHTGDGIMASFRSTAEGLACACNMVLALRRYNENAPDAPVRIRIGLDSGEALLEEGGLFGSVVISAVRICDRAAPEQVLISEAVDAQLAGVSFERRPLGAYELKGFSKPVNLFEVQWENME